MSLVDKAEKAVTVGTAIAGFLNLRFTRNPETGKIDQVTAFPRSRAIWNRDAQGRRTLFGIRLRK